MWFENVNCSIRSRLLVLSPNVKGAGFINSYFIYVTLFLCGAYS